jgi:glyoxylase-like metal-dependent hydrolase (beta-lactamase superfamily II)
MKKYSTFSFIFACSALFGFNANAEAPMVKTQAPGFYRMMLGDFEITALSDGTTSLPLAKILTGTTPVKIEKTLALNHLKDPAETSVNAYLVNTGSKLVLIDTGAANLFGPTLGNMLSNLKAAGYAPEQIDEVYITHLHPDHVGGLMNGDKPAFPNAVVRADQHDADFWLSKTQMQKAPQEAQKFFENAMTSLNPYIMAGKFKPIIAHTGADVELVPGIKAVASYGHTPGHSFYSIESQRQKMVIWGDLMHAAAIQFPNPSISIQFDTDSKSAATQRKKAYADAAKNGYLVGIAHVSFPGVGYLKSASLGYSWMPVNYSSGK